MDRCRVPFQLHIKKVAKYKALRKRITDAAKNDQDGTHLIIKFHYGQN